MGVTTYAPLLERIYEALTTLTAKSRALPSGKLFVRGLLPVPALMEQRANLAKEALSMSPQRLGAVHVMPGAQAVIDTDPELGSEHIFTVTIRVARDYYLGWPQTVRQGPASGLNEVDTALVRAADHFPLIVDALCFAGAHALTDRTSAATGLLTGSLKRARAVASEPLLNAYSGTSGLLLTVTDTFFADVEWTAAA